MVFQCVFTSFKDHLSNMKGMVLAFFFLVKKHDFGGKSCFFGDFKSRFWSQKIIFFHRPQLYFGAEGPFIESWLAGFGQGLTLCVYIIKRVCSAQMGTITNEPKMQLISESYSHQLKDQARQKKSDRGFHTKNCFPSRFIFVFYYFLGGSGPLNPL